MDGLALLGEARGAGLTVSTDGEKLMIQGPGRLEAIAQRLLTNKPDVMTALVAEIEATITEAREMRAAWRGASIELAERCGWPRVPFGPGRAVVAGPNRLRQFVRAGSRAGSPAGRRGAPRSRGLDRGSQSRSTRGGELMTSPVPSGIRGLSEERRTPRIGKVRLGVRALNKKPCRSHTRSGGELSCDRCTHPVMTDHFVFPNDAAVRQLARNVRRLLHRAPGRVPE